MSASVTWMERRQITLYVLALAAGAAAGLLLPGVADPAGLAVTPALGLLLYATFLGVPFGRIGIALRDWRFLGTVLTLNFLVVPVVVFTLTRGIAHDQALLIGVLCVLLTPCIDYVIVFTGLAGGAQDRLLAAAPVLMLAQMLALPLYLWLFVGGEHMGWIDPAPFVEACVTLILIPLGAAALTQFAAARVSWGRVLSDVASQSMVPLMMLTLAVVVASQIGGVRGHLGALAPAIPIFVAFAVLMVPLGAVASRAAGLDLSGRRAVVFSGVTRNSLVVLPIVLALPAGFEIAPLAVVLQTLIELLTMVVLVRALPRLMPQTRASATVE